jgi:hypothetical protein
MTPRVASILGVLADALEEEGELITPAALATLIKHRHTLKLELWADEGGGDCSECGEYQAHGHLRDCNRAAALRDILLMADEQLAASWRGATREDARRFPPPPVFGPPTVEREVQRRGREATEAIRRNHIYGEPVP